MPVARRRPVENDPDEEGTVLTKPQAEPEDDEETPAVARPPRTRTRAVEPDDDGETEDENEEPNHAVIGTGWKDAKRQKEEANGEYAKDFKFTEEEQVVKFLDDAPFAVYQQHWVRRKAGKLSWICIGPSSCPLCKIGEPARKQWNFSVAVIDTDDAGRITVDQKILVTGIRLFNTLEQKNNDKKRGPLTKGYWTLSKSGTGTSTVHSVTPASDRELDEWGIDVALVEPKTAKLKPYEPSIIKLPTKAELRTVADEIDESDD
jgi:hypothetical protein